MNMRGFEIAKGYENNNINLPKRSTMKSAGYDLSLAEDLVIEAGKIGLGVTGIKAYMQDDEVLMLFARSSLPRKYQLILPNGVGIIDADYYGNASNDGLIHVQLMNLGDEKVILKKGERVAQGIFRKFLTVDGEEEITTERTGGFGSTD
ncbi:dUTP diphosphatase [Mycoplasmatota bacterium WC44]